MRKFLIIFIFLFSVWAPLSFAAEITGIIPGQIWYSKDTLTEGDTVKIYTAIWNNNTENLNAKVEFYDKNVVLGSRNIVVLPDQVQEVSVSWKVTSGDHTISAKIISSSLTGKGITGAISLTRVSTNEDRKFIPVVIKKIDGTEASSTDVVKSQIDKADSKIQELIPTSVSKPVSNIIGGIDTFRDQTSSSITQGKIDTQKHISDLEKSTNTKASATKTDATDKPISYIKLFFLTVVSFIFANKLVFYGLIVLAVFMILRYIYFKIRYR